MIMVLYLLLNFNLITKRCYLVYNLTYSYYSLPAHFYILLWLFPYLWRSNGRWINMSKNMNMWTSVNTIIFHSVLLYLVGAVQIFESNVVMFWTHNKWWLAKSDSYILTGPICILDMVTLEVMDPNHAVKVKAVRISRGQQQLCQR